MVGSGKGKRRNIDVAIFQAMGVEQRFVQVESLVNDGAIDDIGAKQFHVEFHLEWVCLQQSAYRNTGIRGMCVHLRGGGRDVTGIEGEGLSGRKRERVRID